MSDLNNIELVHSSYDKTDGCLELTFVDTESQQSKFYKIPIYAYIGYIIEDYLRHSDDTSTLAMKIREAMNRSMLGTCASDIEYIRRKFHEAADKEIENMKRSVEELKKTIEKEKEKAFSSIVDGLL